ncbi:SDR family NAD(P)-dependent oxidoreductase [Rhodococcus jostii]|uniref:SDR family NAD(P)-dependent oxidoreductase n=1 Tax=Rhodococcus jostii TaxID=132919 RepID=UPI00362BFFC8
MSNSTTVFVTGAGSGIGRATATLLADRGYAVAGFDRNGAAVTEFADEINSRGGRALAWEGDVTDTAAVASAVDQTVAHWGHLTGAVACAGIEVVGGVLDLDFEDWQRSLSVNASGVFNLAKGALPHLITSRGSFVAIASDAGTEGAQGYAAYCAAKHAVVGLVKSMALDHGVQGVRSNVVCPSFVETPMATRIFDSTAPGEAEFYRDVIPMGRFALPDEVAKAVAHLLGPDSSFTNGMLYAIDGGGTAGFYRPA